MDPARFLVRRATVDDLNGLKELWTRAGLQVLDLERHLTEFQLISSDTGDLAGALALRLDGRHGLLHSEAFTQINEQDQFRQLLWDRIAVLSRNHGLSRIWTLESAPFWRQVGEFHEAESDELTKLPASFGPAHQRWRTILLRDEEHRGISLDHEIELFQQASRASTNHVMNQTDRLRALAYVVAGVFLVGMFGYVLYLVLGGRRQRQNRSPSSP